MSKGAKPAAGSGTKGRALRSLPGLVVVLLLLALLVVAGGRRGRLAVALTNATPGALTDVSFEGPGGPADGGRFPRVAPGETVRLVLPLSERVVLRLKDADGRPRRSEYPFEYAWGLRHDLSIRLTPPRAPQKGPVMIGRTRTSSSTLILGASVQYEESIDQLEDPENGRVD